MVLGVCDSKIGAAITEEMGVSCQHTGIVPEIVRGKLLHKTACIQILYTSIGDP